MLDERAEELLKAKSKIESGEVQLTKSDSWFCGSLYPLLDPSGQHILNVFRVEVEALLESRTLGRRRPLTPPARMPLTPPRMPLDARYPAVEPLAPCAPEPLCGGRDGIAQAVRVARAEWVGSHYANVV